MVLTTLTGIELLGWLTNKNTFDPKNGSAGFGWYWREFLTPIDSRYGGLADLVYKLVRIGLGHVFVAKPGILVTKGQPNAHLHVDKDKPTLMLDCLELHRHFVASYRQGVEPIVAGQSYPTRTFKVTRASMEQRLREMVDLFEADTAKVFRAYKLPKPSNTQPVQSFSLSSLHTPSGNFPQYVVTEPRLWA